MPELCRFYNIVIKMLYNDDSQHHKPHFHVYYNKYEASVGIDGELLAGSLRSSSSSWCRRGRSYTRMNCTRRGTTPCAASRSGRLSL